MKELISLCTFTPMCTAAPPSSGCFRHDPQCHISPIRLQVLPPTTSIEEAHPPLSSPHRSDASAFVICSVLTRCARLWSWGEPIMQEAACTRGGSSVGANTASAQEGGWRGWLLNTCFGYERYCVVLMWRFSSTEPTPLRTGADPKPYRLTCDSGLCKST